jgi:hypothetical protein
MASKLGGQEVELAANGSIGYAGTNIPLDRYRAGLSHVTEDTVMQLRIIFEGILRTHSCFILFYNDTIS